MAGGGDPLARLTQVKAGAGALGHLKAMVERLLSAYGRPVPRYTSYPTAPHFHAGIDANRAAEWLSAVPADMPASVYLHVPYCSKLCWYCGCNTKIVARAEPVAAFAELLQREISLVSAWLPQRQKVTHVHWGGGTPNILSPVDFCTITAELRTHFAVAPDAEIAVEVDPRTLSTDMMAAFRAAGVTRVSLGVQDFDEKVQQAVNRVQSFATVKQAVLGLRGCGVQSINLDLMYGLPHQTPETIIATVDQAASLDPERIALFGYAHVPWMKKHQRLIDESALPDDQARFELATVAVERLQSRGYEWIGLDHFARPDDPLTRAARSGRLRRNFQGYTTDATEVLLGLGPSAIGTLPQGYVQNATEPGAWADAIRAGRLATVKGIAINADDRLRRAVIERLMCDLAVDLDRVARGFGATASTFAAEKSALAPFVRDGLVELDGDHVRLTAIGRPLMRSVAAVFDRHLAASAARHSRAV